MNGYYIQDTNINSIVAGKPRAASSMFPYENFPNKGQECITQNDCWSFPYQDPFGSWVTTIWGEKLLEPTPFTQLGVPEQDQFVKYTTAPWVSHAGVFIEDDEEKARFHTFEHIFADDNTYSSANSYVAVTFTAGDNIKENGLGKLTCSLYGWNISQKKWVHRRNLCSNLTFNRYALISLQGAGGASNNNHGGGGGCFLQLAVDLHNVHTLYIRPMWHGTRLSNGARNSGDGDGIVITSKSPGTDSDGMFHESQGIGTWAIYVPGGYQGSNGGGTSRAPVFSGCTLGASGAVDTWTTAVTDDLFNIVIDKEYSGTVTSTHRVRPVCIKTGQAGHTDYGSDALCNYQFGMGEHLIFDVLTPIRRAGGQTLYGGGASVSGNAAQTASYAGPGGGGSFNGGKPRSSTDINYLFAGPCAFSIYSLK